MPYETRLVVNRNTDGYTARWVEPDNQESQEFPLVLPLTAADASDLRWYLETYLQFPGAGDRARAQAIEQKLDAWGHALFGAIFGGAEGTNVYRNLMGADGARLLTIGSTDSDLLSQPWEMMRDARGPLAFQGVTIRRQLKGSGATRRYELGLPLRVLLIVSRPTDAGFIDPRNSIAPLLDALDALPGQVVVDFCDPPTFPRLEEMVSQARKDNRPYHIVHFDGHGTYLPYTGVGALAFEDDNAMTRLIAGTELGDLLARLEVPVVLLEACRSASLSNRPVFGSVAPALLQSGVGSVIAFSHAVHIQAAKLLVERFYRELCAGRSVGQAVEESRTRLHADRARWLHLGPHAETIDLQDWFIPQLYQVGADPVLVTAGNHAGLPLPTGTHKAMLLQGFPPPPMYRFHGRAQELLDIERAFRRYNAVLVSGMGGMGKTALAREAAAWWLRKGLFESAVFCSFEQRAGAERIVQLIGTAIEGDSFSARASADQWATAVALFHQRRVLVVWDNFESTLPTFDVGTTLGGRPDVGDEGNDVGATLGGRPPSRDEGNHAEQGNHIGLPLQTPTMFGADARARLLQLYRELTEGKPAGRLLVTCRPAETGLPGIKELPLTGLARPDSLHLLAAALDQKSIVLDEQNEAYKRAEIDALLDALDDHPLSIELIAPHLKTLTPKEIREERGKYIARFANADALEARNQSLLASLAFSTQRLSADAQAVLPYLAWFEGGVFEQFLLGFAQLDAERWAVIRNELVATALVKVEDEGIQINKRPYLRFHPTLPYAARADAVPNPDETEQRFIAVYLDVMRIADKALRGNQPAAGMALVAREEANLRAAMHRAFRRGARQDGWQVADTLNVYLQMAGRLRERDALVEWVRAQMPEGAGLDEATCAAIRDQAWSRFTQGHADEAIKSVQDLIARLETEGLAGGADARFQIATSYLQLSHIYVSANRPDLTTAPAQKAIALFEQLPGDDARGNLSAALGDLANAYSALGKFDVALEAAERGLAIDREMGHNREIAVGLGQIAAILTQQHRYAEADSRYAEALRAAQSAGDLGLQGTTLQHQAFLYREQGNLDRAVELFKQAITLFQRVANPGDEMRTCDLLATAEAQRGQLDAAEAWYTRSRELALQLNDRAQLAANAQNVGILYQTRAEQAKEPATRAAFLQKAVASVQESLAIKLERQDQFAAASSYSQLGLLYQMLGDLDQAEKHALQALQIRESLNLPDVYKDYGNLANIARARGDADAAAQWQAKYEAKVKELERLRRGEGREAGGGEQLAQLILALAQAAYQARASRVALRPDAAEVLAQLVAAPPPLGAVGALLQDVASGKPVPAVPPGLPPALKEILDQLVEAVKEIDKVAR